MARIFVFGGVCGWERGRGWRFLVSVEMGESGLWGRVGEFALADACHFQKYLAHVRQHLFGNRVAVRCCRNLSPCQCSAQYSLAAPKSPPLESFASVAKTSVLASPATVRGGLAGTLYTTPFSAVYLVSKSEHLSKSRRYLHLKRSPSWYMSLSSGKSKTPIRLAPRRSHVFRDA